jgi:GH15 family glucan-1,4-alpha-glucosidase
MNWKLYSKSIELILENQSVTGAYVASPSFPTYNYCWLRDGSFIAHAMDTAGEFTSAEAFFRWVGRTIQKFSYKVEDIRQRLETGQAIGKDDVLHTRFTLDGEEVYVDSTWGNFQIDGYGSWLWALAEHVRLSGDSALLKELSEPILTSLRYLELVWELPNYDCWEEHPEYLHPYSLATVFAGFDAVVSLVRTGQMDPTPVDVEQLAQKVKEFILEYGVYKDRLVKHIQPADPNTPPQPVLHSGVDSSLLGLTIPYNVLSPHDPIIQNTIQSIEADLHRPNGGVYRYLADVYYGGGEWHLLTAWLGWYYAHIGKKEQAQVMLEWIESKEEAGGFLSEQVSDHVLAPIHYEPWLKKWGPIASPLLWSHAMYIILINSIQEDKTR